MHELIGKEVEVETSETIYRGVLIEITENEVNLQSEIGWLTIPNEKIASVREVE
jgi:hypothetical protein